MRRALILVAALALGSGCASTYASEPSSARNWPNGWTDKEVGKLTASLRESRSFDSLPEDRQACAVAGLVAEFHPYQISGELSSTVKSKAIEIMGSC